MIFHDETLLSTGKLWAKAWAEAPIFASFSRALGRPDSAKPQGRLGMREPTTNNNNLHQLAVNQQEPTITNNNN